MKFQLPERAFPPLVLSAHEERDLIDEADRIIEETIAAQERYIQRGRRIEHGQWKHFRTKEGIQVYRQRSLSTKKLFDPLVAADEDARSDTRSDRSAGTTTSAASWLPVRDGFASETVAGSRLGGRHQSSGMFSFRAKTPGMRRAPQSTKSAASMEAVPLSPSSSIDNTSVTSEHGWMEYQRKPAHIPGLLAVGVVDGTLEDAMYGCVTEDDASWRWKSSQINDKFDDARLLATIRGPTREDPFRFIGVKWFTKEHPSVLDSVVKRRDFLTIEAMGMTTDTSGTVRLGYFMMHSIDLPRIPVLSDLNILRGQASFCFILRQAGPSSIEIFARGFSDPQGDMYEAVSVMLASESVLAAVRIVDFGHIKKLRWLMMNRRQQRLINQEIDSSTCTTCQKPIKRLGSLFQSSSTCQVCHASVCGKCVITKHITVDITVDGATQKPLPFCLSCVMEAKNLNATDLAIQEIAKRQYELLPTDLFVGSESVYGFRKRDAQQRRAQDAMQRAASAPVMTKARGNSRVRTASSGRELHGHSSTNSVNQPQLRRREPGQVVLY